MRVDLNIVFVVSTCLAAVLCPSAAMGQRNLEDEVRKLAKPYIESKTAMAISIGVWNAGQIGTVHVGKTSEKGEAPDDDTLYEIGSISKVFTGILLADAVKRGEVSLEQPVSELLPGGGKMPQWEDKPIRLINLSTHDSGLPRLSNNMPSLHSNNPYSDYTSDLALVFLGKHKLRRAPGKKGEYSNFAVSLLGYLISKKADLTYDQLLQQRLAGPLGMQDTRVELTADLKERLATPHLSSLDPYSTWEFADMPGAGGIRSSISDMMRFIEFNISPPKNEVGAALELAWEKHRKGEGGEFDMGLGWHFARDGSTRWHNGQTGGYHSMLLVNRKLNIGCVLLCNTATGEVDQLAEQVVKLLVGGEVKPREFKKNEKEIEVDAEIMKRYVGKYQIAPGAVFEIELKDKKLMAKLTGQPSVQVYARSETEWFYKVVKASLTFNVNDKGKCESLVLHQFGLKQVGKRIK